MDIINSTNNKKIREVAKLLSKKYRKQTGKFIIEGHHLIKEAASTGLVEEVFTTTSTLPGTLVSDFVLKKMSDSKSPQSIIAVCRVPKRKPLGNKVLALDNVQDPGNVGTLIRTALAFGFTDVIVNGVDLFSPKVVRSSQGAVLKVNVLQTNDISEYFEGYNVIGAMVSKEAKNYKDVELNGKFMVVLGNEGNGISEKIAKLLDEQVYIPINFESLNVASAGAILLNEYQ